MLRVIDAQNKIDKQIVMSMANMLSADGLLFQFGSNFGAPVHLSGSELFVSLKSQGGAVYVVPETCLFRLATTPLQVLAGIVSFSFSDQSCPLLPRSRKVRERDSWG